jgi:hypothetical protein
MRAHPVRAENVGGGGAITDAPPFGRGLFRDVAIDPDTTTTSAGLIPFGSPGRRRLADAGQHALGRLEVLLVFRADSENEIDERLKADPWTRSGILSTSRIARWEPTARRGGVESSHDSPLEGGSIEAQRRNGLLLTRRWREMNSNFRFRDRQAKWRRMRYGFSCSTTERLLGLTLAGDDLSGLPKTFPATHHVDNGSDVRASPTGMPALYPRP